MKGQHKDRYAAMERFYIHMGINFPRMRQMRRLAPKPYELSARVRVRAFGSLFRCGLSCGRKAVQKRMDGSVQTLSSSESSTQRLCSMLSPLASTSTSSPPGRTRDHEQTVLSVLSACSFCRVWCVGRGDSRDSHVFSIFGYHKGFLTSNRLATLNEDHVVHRDISLETAYIVLSSSLLARACIGLIYCSQLEGSCRI